MNKLFYMIMAVVTVFALSSAHAKDHEYSLSDAGADFIIKHESFSNKAYYDQAGRLTIGVGHLVLPEDGVTINTKWSNRIVKRVFRNDVKKFERAVNKYVKVNLSQHEFDALVSFAFNVGPNAFRKSTLLRKLNNGDIGGAAEEFYRWVYVNGKQHGDLEERRDAEYFLFYYGFYN